MQERRSQRRLSTRIPIRVMLPGSRQVIAVENQNISWGGAQFLTRDPAVWRDDRFRLIFPWTKGESFSAEADVVRRETLEDGRTSIAARFACLTHGDETRLESLLQLLVGREDKTTDHASPLVETLELDLADADEMRDRLEQIAEGGLTLIVFGAYRVGQSILVSINGTKDAPELRLRARVFEQEILSFPFSNQQDLVKLDLRFEHPDEDLRGVAENLLK